MIKILLILFLCCSLVRADEIVIQTTSIKVVRVEGTLVFKDGAWKLTFDNGKTLQKLLGYPKTTKRIVLLLPLEN